MQVYQIKVIKCVKRDCQEAVIRSREHKEIPTDDITLETNTQQ